MTGEDFDRFVLSDGERGTHARSARTTCAFAASLWSTKIQQLAKTSDFLGRLGRVLGNALPMQSPESCGNSTKVRRRARRKVECRRKRQCEVGMIFSVLERVPSWSSGFWFRGPKFIAGCRDFGDPQHVWPICGRCARRTGDERHDLGLGGP